MWTHSLNIPILKIQCIHARTHTHALVYQGNGIEDKVSEKKDLKEPSEVVE